MNIGKKNLKVNSDSELSIQIEDVPSNGNTNRQNIIKLLSNWRIILLISLSVASIIAFSVVTFLKGPELVKLLNYARDEILKQPHWGVLAIVAFCFISCFPPFTGHGFCSMFTGYIFGVGWGFLIIYPTTVAGIIGCYWLGRYIFYNQVQNVLAKFPSIRKLDQRIEVDGIKLVILLRLGPYPFSWLNLMFSSISVSFWQYFWVVVVVSARVALSIYIGTTLDSLLDLFHSGLNGNRAQLIGFCVSMCFLVISSTYTIYYFRKTLKNDENANDEGEINPTHNV